MTYRRTPTQSVLLVDDDEDCRILYKAALEHAGFRVSVATCGADGLQLCDQLKPDVVLMDLQLPDMDGRDALRRLKADPQFADTPVLAITAAGSPQDRPQLIDDGFADALIKPIYPAAVVAAIQGRFAAG